MAGVRVAGRDRYLDLLRGLAIVRVVVFHAFGFVWLPWLPAMGVMFALGGSLTARSVDRSAVRAVTSRLRRLLPVLWVFGVVWIPLMAWHGWGAADPRPPWRPDLLLWIVPLADPPGSAWGDDLATGVLWYLKTYLWLVLLSPLLLRAFRRLPWVTIAAPLVLIAGFDLGYLPAEGLWGSSVYDVLTFLACWLVGFAHADGLLRRVPLAVLAAVGAAAAAVSVVWLATLGRSWGTGWSLEESSTAQALYSFGVVLVLLRFRPQMAWLARRPVADRLVTVLNARAVTVYLWHNAAIAAAMALCGRVDVWRWEFWFPLAWVLIGVAVVAFGWVEDLAARRRPVLWPGGTGAPTPVPARGASQA